MPSVTVPTGTLSLTGFAPSIEASVRIYQAYLEVPDLDRSVRIYQAYLRVPDAARTVRIYQAFLEVPDLERSVRVYQAFLRVPDTPSGTGGGIPAGDGIDPGTGEEIVVDFDRTILETVAVPEFITPRGKSSWAHTGKGQFRAGFSAGRTWTEDFQPRNLSDPSMRAFMAYVNDLSQNERIFEIDYRPYFLHGPFGTISGTATVSGAGQTGFGIVSAGWSGTLLRGDLIRIDGLNHVMEVVEDVTGPGGTGTATIKVNPGILVGGSPADGAEIFYGTAVKFRAKIDDISNVPRVDAEHVWFSPRVRFREAP